MNKAKPLYITIVTDTGNRRDAVADIPEKKPNKAEFDQYAMMQSQRREYVAHIYSRGMEYTEEEAAGMVNFLINDPIARAGLIKRPVGLLGDHRRANALLVSDDPTRNIIHVVEAQVTGDTAEIRPHQSRKLIPASYPLDLIFDTYKAAGFDLYEIPPTDPPAVSRGFVLRHRTVKLSFQELAGIFIRAIHQAAGE